MMTQPPRSLVPQTWRQPQWRRRWQCDKDGCYQTEGGLWQQGRSGRRGDWNARRHEWKRGALADSAPGVRTKVLQTHRKQASRGYRAQSRLARRGETQPQSRQVQCPDGHPQLRDWAFILKRSDGTAVRLQPQWSKKDIPTFYICVGERRGNPTPSQRVWAD